MNKEPPFFTLEHRVIAWNLLYDFARRVNKMGGFGLSPFLTTAYTYLLRFFNNPKIIAKGENKPDKDLFTLVVVSEIVSSKQFMQSNIDQFIRINFEIIDQYTPEQREILGESTRFSQGDELSFQEFKSGVLTAELYLLTYIDWNLLSCSDFPFIYFQHWGQIIAQEAKRKSEAQLDQFRRMRGKAIHIMITLMVALNEPFLKPDVLAAASIQGALTYVPLESYSTAVDNEIFWAKLVKADVDVGEFIALSKNIPDALEAIQPFILSTKNES